MAGTEEGKGDDSPDPQTNRGKFKNTQKFMLDYPKGSS